MTEQNVVFETFYNRKKSFDSPLTSYCERVDEITFIHHLFPERKFQFKLDKEKTAFMETQFHDPICVFLQTFKTETKTIVMVLKEDELLAGLFDLGDHDIISLEQKRFSEVGIFQPIITTEQDYFMFNVNERFLTYLYETNEYRLPYLTGSLQIKYVQ